MRKRKYLIEAGRNWYEHWCPRNPEWFEKPKIITPDISDKCNFAIDEQGLYGTNTLFVIPLEEKYKGLYKYILGLLNSKCLEFYFKNTTPFISGGYYRFIPQYLKELPIKLPQTSKEEKLAQEITDKVELILSQVKIEQCIESFPDSYLEKMQGIELDELVHTFQANHKSLEPEITELVDGGYGISLGKKEEPINVETKERAKYIIMATKNKKVRKDEKLKILIPKDEKRVKELLREYEKDKKKLEEMPVSKLEEEINELVYELYGLDSKKDREVIESFLQKF